MEHQRCANKKAQGRAKRRPGSRHRKCKKPCKGATRRGAKFVAPLQGFDCGATNNPGRRCACPGLFCLRTVGAQRKALYIAKNHNVPILKSGDVQLTTSH